MSAKDLIAAAAGAASAVPFYQRIVSRITRTLNFANIRGILVNNSKTCYIYGYAVTTSNQDGYIISKPSNLTSTAYNQFFYGISDTGRYDEIATVSFDGTYYYKVLLSGSSALAIAKGNGIPDNDSYYINLAGNSFDYGSGVADLSGNFYFFARHTSTKACLVKITSTGTLGWATDINTGTGTGVQYSAVVKNIAVDSSGNIILVFSTYITGTNIPVVIVKFNSSGTIVWQKEILFSTDISTIGGVDVDSVGNIYASCRDSTYGYIFKFNSSGSIQWQRKIAGRAFTDITVDKTTGDSYVTGTDILAKYNTSGAIQWQRGFGGRIAGAVTLDPVDPTIYVACFSGYNSSVIYFNLPTDGTATGTNTVCNYTVTSYVESAANGDVSTSAYTSSSTSPTIASATFFSQGGNTGTLTYTYVALN